MCGVNGFFNTYTTMPASNVIEQMNTAIRNRGPDAGDSWQDESVGLVLGHRRLAVQDLSPAGAQPMHSNCGRYVIVFNGEIYNHLELREQLMAEHKAPNWRGHSDTETMLACFVAWGIKSTLQAMVGMFAIALWDRQQKILTLAKDRMGEKPLYWGWQGKSLYFGSDLKGLKAHPAFKTDINRDAITLLLRHNCIPAPYSIYKGIEKLRPGHWLQLPLANIEKAKNSQPQSYWCFNDIVENGLSNPFTGSPEQAVDALELALTKSIGDQIVVA